jgi:hypothetical protein
MFKRNSVAPASFMVPPKDFIVINPSEEWQCIVSSPVEFVVPPRNVSVTAETHQGTDNLSAVDHDGDTVPGTLVVGDVRDEGRLVWNAAEGLRAALGINANGEYATGLGLRGLAVLPAGATREEIEEVRAQGIERLNAASVESARATVAAHDEKNDIRRRLNMPLLPGDDTYVKASLLLGKLTASHASEIEESLAPTADDDDGLMVFAREKARAVAAKVPDTNVEEVASEILKDAEALKLIKKQYRTNLRNKSARA